MKLPKITWGKKGEGEEGESGIHVSPAALVYSVLTLLVVLFALSLIWVYAWPNMLGSKMETLRERMPYPMVVIFPNQVITFREYHENTTAMQRFYENQDFSKLGLRVDFSTEEGQKRLLVRKKEVLNKMVEDSALRVIAKEEGIIVTKDVARDGVKRTLEEYGTSTRVQEDLDRLYGFTLAQFEEKVVVPKLYQEKVGAFFEEKNKPSARAKERIELAKKELDQGNVFSEVAKEFSEGQTKGDGGSLGWFQLSDLAPELRSVVPSQTIGLPGSIVETEFGYHIVLLEEVKKEEGRTLYRLSQIFTRKDLFADWLTKKMQNMRVYILSPDYRFDQGEAAVKFKDATMQRFETELYSKPGGDPLFLF